MLKLSALWFREVTLPPEHRHEGILPLHSAHKLCPSQGLFEILLIPKQQLRREGYIVNPHLGN